MITCRWCGTNYTSFQPNCPNCGGSLPLPAEHPVERNGDGITVPPPAPRNVPPNYAWRILSSDGWAIAGGVFLLLGGIFGVLGIGLTLGIITAFVGLPFAGLGLLMLGVGAVLVIWRYQVAQRTVEVLRKGEAVLGELVKVHQNLYVRVNGRHPWTVDYRYEVDGKWYDGRVVTLIRPELRLQTGTGVYVLYKPGEPRQSTIFPHPYGYDGV